jgi:hypothetical protein
MDTDTLVAEQHIPNAENDCLAHKALTVTAVLFSRSVRCTAQARHGSKEWMVRSGSSGRSESATGVPSNATS